MTNSKTIRFSAKGKEIYIVFDLSGDIVEAKGFNSLMWSTPNIDKEIIGKNVDELLELLKKYGIGSAYGDFQEKVHIPLLKWIIQNQKYINKSIN